jgi:large subunit ribosomal protein L7/L12
MTVVQELLEKIEKLTLLEASELVKAMEEKFGVSAAAPVAVAAVAASGAAPAEEAPEETDVSVILESVGPNKINVLKEIRVITGLGLKEAKDLVDNAPQPVKEGIKKEEAAEIKAKLEAVGAIIKVK